MADEIITKREILLIIGRVAVFSAFSYFAFSWLIDAVDPTRKQQMKAKERAKKLMKALGISPKTQLNSHELMIASNLIVPESITVSWSDIAGLESVIDELKETVIFPIRERELFAQSKLTQAPRGVLLHGPPGCGKTMIAKATAKEAGARFINLDVSQITDKWYGESQKLATAVFTLATKISPCIVFIDEIDSLLRSRDTQDHEATAMVKAQFMQMWDGLETHPDACVVVMGATNRPKDVDKAIIRRLPATFHIGLPTAEQRRDILLHIVGMEELADGVDFDRLAQLTAGFSGSDLREACRSASVFRVREAMAAKKASASDSPAALRRITNDDLMRSVAKMRESKLHCGTVSSFAITDLE